MIEQWVHKTCKFADGAHGPLPTSQNPYGQFLPVGVEFDQSSNTMTFETKLGKISLALSPEQAERFSSVFEKEIRKDYWSSQKGQMVRNLARQLMVGKGEENRDWFLVHDDGLEIYNIGNTSPIYKISPEELAQKYGILHEY